jgi:hypothetical protein
MRHWALVIALSTVAALGPLAAQSSKPQTPAAPPLFGPVDPAELAMTDSRVEKGADAEALLWDTRVTDGVDMRGVFTEYRYLIRIKIFTDRGRDQYATVSVPVNGRIEVSGIAGRTVRPDGTIVELKAADIFERTIAKLGTFSLRVKTFVMPAVEKGSVIEYRYTEHRLGTLSENLQLFFQRTLPVQRAVYHIKPLSVPGRISGMKAQWYHATPEQFTREPDGAMMTSQSGLPAFHPEPMMPPAAELQPWLFVFYVTPQDIAQSRDASVYWTTVGKAMSENFKAATAKIVTIEVTKAAEPVRAAAGLEAKIAAALAVTRTVTPLDAAPAELQKKFKFDQTVSDTLKRGVGGESHVRMLFAALALAGGLEVQGALAANRENLFMDPESANVAFLPEPLLVVRLAGDTRFVDPTNRYSMTGSVHWQQENEPALVGADANPGLVPVPLSPAQASVKTRSATLRLLEDGTVEGDLTGEFSGHFSVGSKESYAQGTPAEWEKGFKESFTEHMTGVELTALKFLGLESPTASFGYSLHLRMSGYAQKTGTRLFVRPAVFEYGEPPMFAAATRVNPIYFPFPWTERDTVTLTLPAGYEFEDAAPPPPATFGGHGAYEYAFTVSPDRHQVVLKRTLVFCNTRQILFGVDEYPNIKKFFDLVGQNDAFALSVRRAAQ